MKKIVYLLLITLSFAACKKNKNKAKDAANEITIKGKWKTIEAKTEHYDAAGNIVRSDYEECKPEESFCVEFDGNNKVVLTDFNNTNESTSAYVYQNGCLTIIKDDDKDKNLKVTSVWKPTANSMVWQIESDDKKEDAINSTALQNSISQQIVKTIVYYTFIKVNK